MTSPAATAHADQFAAATRTAHNTVRAASHLTGGRLLHTDHQPRWVRTHIAALQLAHVAGRADYCPHLPGSPTVLHAAVWAPNRIVCTACAPTLLPDPTEDTTCDRCRHQVTRIHSGAVAFGPLILGYGLCVPCLTIIGKETR